jgi:hypothetical protein
MPKRNYRGDFELMVMLALLRLGDGAYGVPIRWKSSCNPVASLRSAAYKQCWSGWKAEDSSRLIWASQWATNVVTLVTNGQAGSCTTLQKQGT